MGYGDEGVGMGGPYISLTNIITLHQYQANWLVAR